MTKEEIIRYTPVFNAIKAGKNVQIFDSLSLCLHKRGWWKTVDNWGFGGNKLHYFRIKNEDGSIEYFDDKSKLLDQHDLDEPKKWCNNYENYIS